VHLAWPEGLYPQGELQTLHCSAGEASGPVSRLVATKSVSGSRSVLFCFFLPGHKFSKLLPGTWPPLSSPPPPPPLYLCLTNDQGWKEYVFYYLCRNWVLSML